MTTDTPTVGDRYARATSSSDLTLHAGRCDADKLLAAGYAARRDTRGLMALHVYRMRVTGDRAGLPPAIDTAIGWIVGRGVRAGGRNKVSRLDAREVAERTLHWWLQDVCSACEGVKYERVPGTPKLSAKLCIVCQGVGRHPLTSIVKPKHLEHSRWLASELDALCGYVMADMARLLGASMDLATTD